MDTRHLGPRRRREMRKGQVVELLRTQTLSRGEIQALTGFRAATLGFYLTDLEINGWVKSYPVSHSRLRLYHTVRDEAYPVPAEVTSSAGYQRKVPDEKPLPGGRIIRFDGKDAPNHYAERRFDYEVKQGDVHIAVSPIYEIG